MSNVPQPGDRILVFKEQWLKLVLKKKTMDIRGKRLSSGAWWLGCKGEIRGKAFFGKAVPIEDVETWVSLQPQHHVEAEKLPYKQTFGMPILHARRVKNPVKYLHPKGAVGIVRFRPVE